MRRTETSITGRSLHHCRDTGVYDEVGRDVGHYGHEETSHSDKKEVARDLLRRREGAIADGVPVTAKINRFRFEEAAADLMTEYKVNKRRSLDELERRIEKHLKPFFGGRRMAAITTSDVRTYIAERQAATELLKKAYTLRRKDGTTITIPEQRRSITGPSNAEINRELTILKRMFTLAMQAGKLLHRPHVPMLEERNTRKGFFELDMLHGVFAHLPESLRAVIEFAYITVGAFPLKCLRLNGVRSTSRLAKSGWTQRRRRTAKAGYFQ